MGLSASIRTVENTLSSVAKCSKGAIAPHNNGRRWCGAAHWQSHWLIHYGVRKTLHWEGDASNRGEQWWMCVMRSSTECRMSQRIYACLTDMTWNNQMAVAPACILFAVNFLSSHFQLYGHINVFKGWVQVDGWWTHYACPPTSLLVLLVPSLLAQVSLKKKWTWGELNNCKVTMILLLTKPMLTGDMVFLSINPHYSYIHLTWVCS